MKDRSEALPPLPEPEARFSVDSSGRWKENLVGKQGMPMFTAEHMHAFARAAHAQRQQVPEGWQLVPVEPTQEMTEAGATSINYNGGNARWSDIREAWADMLAAAPALTAAPSAQAEPQVPCLMRYVPVWKTSDNGMLYQESNFACATCGYNGKHDANPGCRRGIGKQESK